jgi:hypothetical protein
MSESSYQPLAVSSRLEEIEVRSLRTLTDGCRLKADSILLCWRAQTPRQLQTAEFRQSLPIWPTIPVVLNALT